MNKEPIGKADANQAKGTLLLMELETETLAEGQEWMRRRIQGKLADLAQKQGRLSPSGDPLREAKQRDLRLRTSFGEVSVKVFRGRDRQTGRWGCPLRKLWGLRPHQRISPALEEKLCYTATEVGSYEKAARMAAKWGSPADDSTIHSLVQIGRAHV